jgi:hypothetical protein
MAVRYRAVVVRGFGRARKDCKAALHCFDLCLNVWCAAGKMASAQNKGIIKAVISCDTIIVMGAPQVLARLLWLLPLQILLTSTQCVNILRIRFLLAAAFPHRGTMLASFFLLCLSLFLCSFTLAEKAALSRAEFFRFAIL